MRALVLEEPGCLSLQRVSVPEPSEGEILIKVKAATTCGTDLKAFQRGHPQIPMPGVFGHEYSGVVEAAGANAKFKQGDAIMGVHSAPCGDCFWCRRDQENLCESIMSTKVLGSFAEYLLIPKRIVENNVFSKPVELDFALASLLEPLACVAQATRLLTVRPDDRVLVIGPGAIGLMFTAALRLLGVESVTLAGRNRERLAVGEKLGAIPVAIEQAGKTLGNGYDVVIECTGSVEIWEKSLDFVRRGGSVVLFGGCAAGSHVSFDTKRVHYDQITLLSPFHFGKEAVRLAREWLLNPLMDLRPLLSGERRLEDGDRTFEDLRAGRGLKYVFTP